ncbi:hypothetical protein AMECASPLE_010964 [Ameca splendens]|uniref:Uncharacterized protein n=1 Tax=Ameca splendens TaxID=208324 RepID=A0ABV1A833_9TELE
MEKGGRHAAKVARAVRQIRMHQGPKPFNIGRTPHHCATPTPKMACASPVGKSISPLKRLSLFLVKFISIHFVKKLNLSNVPAKPERNYNYLSGRETRFLKVDCWAQHVT